jgi:hypothetical protein
MHEITGHSDPTGMRRAGNFEYTRSLKCEMIPARYDNEESREMGSRHATHVLCLETNDKEEQNYDE